MKCFLTNDVRSALVHTFVTLIPGQQGWELRSKSLVESSQLFGRSGQTNWNVFVGWDSLENIYKVRKQGGGIFEQKQLLVNTIVLCVYGRKKTSVKPLSEHYLWSHDLQNCQNMLLGKGHAYGWNNLCPHPWSEVFCHSPTHGNMSKSQRGEGHG